MNPISLNAPLVKLTPTTGNDTDTLPAGCQQVVIYNAGPSLAFVASSAAATTTAVVDTSTPIPAGAMLTYSVDQSHRSIAAICASGNATVYVSAGPGV